MFINPVYRYFTSGQIIWGTNVPLGELARMMRALMTVWLKKQLLKPVVFKKRYEEKVT